MPNVLLTAALRSEYTHLFATCEVSPARLGATDDVVNRIVSNQSRYQSVGGALNIPWFFIGAIHHMEAGLSFSGHLHNGDPLTARTLHVPKGRPLTGTPPFTWEESARDALKLEGLDHVTDWTTPGLLYQAEKYNGFGYRTNHPETLSPYLWSASNQYTKGKYTADGKYDPDAVSTQIGAAVVLRRMAENQVILFDASGNPIADGTLTSTITAMEPPVTYSETDSSPAARTLQAALNQFPGVSLFVDGVPGQRTSDAFRRVTGHFLKGDPRASAAVVVT